MRRRKSPRASTRDPEWLQFQDLVARLERVLAPSGATIKSPDRLPSKRGSRTREVDATIRYQGLGSASVLITVECRRQRHTQDVRWIEELATKRRAIGAHLTIAVSATPFSAGAVATATEEDIQLRVLREITDAEIGSWRQGVRVNAQQVRVVLHAATFTTDPPTPEPDWADEVVEGFQRGEPLYAPLLRLGTTGTPICAMDLVNLQRLQGQDPAEGVTEGSGPIRRLLRLRSPSHALLLNTKAGGVRVVEAELEFDVTVFSEPVPLTKAFEYHDEAQPRELVTESSGVIESGNRIRFTLARSAAPVPASALPSDLRVDQHDGPVLLWRAMAEVLPPAPQQASQPPSRANP